MKQWRCSYSATPRVLKLGRLRLKCDGTRAETRFRLSAKRTSPFKSAGASVQSITGSRGMRISGSNAGYTKFRASEGTGYPLHSPVSPSFPLPCVTVFHRVSAELYHMEQSCHLHSPAILPHRKRATGKKAKNRPQNQALEAEDKNPCYCR